MITDKTEQKKFIERLARKILNELKYNKLSVYQWDAFISNASNEDNLLNYFEIQIKLVLDKLLSNNIFEFNANSLKLLKKITKDTNEIEKNVSIVSFKKENIDENVIVDYNLFADLTLEEFILGAIWTTTVGELLDQQFRNEIYGNRISTDSYSFFKYYLKSFTKFRNKAFETIEHLSDNNDEGLCIQLDIERCFYNVEIKNLEKEISEFLEKTFKSKNLDYLIYDKINKIIFSYIKTFNSNNVEEFSKLKVGNTSEQNRALPIGFLPSSILANYYLQKLDNSFIKEFNPVSYGRYADDIIMVIKNDISLFIKEDAKLDYYTKKITKIIEEFNDGKEVKLSAKADKWVYFTIDRQTDRTYIRKFKEITEKLSSDFDRIIDINDLNYEFDASYEIFGDGIRFQELYSINKDKKKIARLISALFHTICREPIVQPKRIKKLSSEFIELFFENIDDSLFLELYQYWPMILLLERLSQEGSLEKITIDSTNYFEEVKNDLKLILRLESLQKIDDDFGVFLNRAMQVLKNLLLSNGRLWKNLIYNFALPKFLNPDFIDNSLTLSDKQLRIIHTYLSEVTYIATKNKTDTGKDFLEELIEPKFTYSSEDIELTADLVILQANFNKGKENFEYFLTHSKRNDKFSSLAEVLNQSNKRISKNQRAMLIFPELGVNIEDIFTLVRFVKNTGIMVIGGFDYLKICNEVYNLSFSLFPFYNQKKNQMDCFLSVQPKNYLAPAEVKRFSEIRSNLSEDKESNNRILYQVNSPNFDTILKFEFLGTKHAIFNCYEAADLKLKSYLVDYNPHFVHLITNNTDVEYFDKIGETLSRELMCCTTTTNYSEYGGTNVFIPFKKRYQRYISRHKGSDSNHVFSSKINLSQIKQAKYDNGNSQMKTNPPWLYYKNYSGGIKNDND